jgi:transposase
LRVVGSRKRIYNAEFREGAVRIVTETGKPIPEVAEELGVHPGTLHRVSRAKRNGSPS